MKLVSLNVGKPQSFYYNGKECITSIFKYPVEGQRSVSNLNIEGDEQADLTFHGGELKAVYAYDVSCYDHWKSILQRDAWEYGLFGENFTTIGLTDDDIFIGNIYQVGTVYLKAVQPRFPCFKLNIRFNTGDMIQRFAHEQKHGTYFSVVQQGSLQAGDAIKLIEASKLKITIQQLVEAFYNKGADKSIVKQILAVDFLPERLRRVFESYMQ